MAILYDPRLQVGTKRRVETLKWEGGNFRTNGIKTGGQVSSGLIHIREAIINGQDCNPEHYRVPNGRSDALLVREGIMHLHLYKGSNELLFLRQHTDFVLFIELNTHAPFEYDPDAIAYFQHTYLNSIYQTEQKIAQDMAKEFQQKLDAFERLRSSLGRPGKDEK